MITTRKEFIRGLFASYNSTSTSWVVFCVVPGNEELRFYYSDLYKIPNIVTNEFVLELSSSVHKASGNICIKNIKLKGSYEGEISSLDRYSSFSLVSENVFESCLRLVLKFQELEGLYA